MLVFLFLIIPHYTYPPDSALDLAPSFIPSLAVVVTLLLAVLLGIMGLLSRKTDDDLHEEFGEEASGVGLQEFKNLGLWILVSICAWFGTKFIGFEPTMAMLLAAGLYFAGLRNYNLMVVIALTIPIVLSEGAWYVFVSELPDPFQLRFWRT